MCVTPIYEWSALLRINIRTTTKVNITMKYMKGMLYLYCHYLLIHRWSNKATHIHIVNSICHTYMEVQPWNQLSKIQLTGMTICLLWGKSMCVGTCECACMRAHTLYNVAKVMYRNQVHSKGEANMPAYSGWWNKLTL